MYVHDLHNDLILPVVKVGFDCAHDDEGKVCIGDTLLQMYIPKHINPMSNRHNIVYTCKTCNS